MTTSERLLSSCNGSLRLQKGEVLIASDGRWSLVRNEDTSRYSAYLLHGDFAIRREESLCIDCGEAAPINLLSVLKMVTERDEDY